MRSPTIKHRPWPSTQSHPLVVDSVDAIQSQHAKKLSPIAEKGEPPSLGTEEYEKRGREDWRIAQGLFKDSWKRMGTCQLRYLK